jgi:hypothetical protein
MKKMEVVLIAQIPAIIVSGKQLTALHVKLIKPQVLYNIYTMVDACFPAQIKHLSLE